MAAFFLSLQAWAAERTKAGVREAANTDFSQC